MSLNWTKSGYKNTPDYQLSGIPYVFASSGSDNALNTAHQVHGAFKDPASGRKWIPIQISLPFVARWFCVFNSEPVHRKVRVAFTFEGLLSGSYLTVDKFEWDIFDYAAELGVTDIFLASDHPTIRTQFGFIAGMTNIPRGEAPVFSASFGFEGSGTGGHGIYDPTKHAIINSTYTP